jgi:hypothetical protein
VNEVTCREPSLIERARYSASRIPDRARNWLRDKMIRTVVRLSSDSGYIAHAKRELADSLKSEENGPNRWMANDLIALLSVFAAQGHSGSSAPWCASAFAKLAKFEPLGPLTGADSEWHEVGNGVFQNLRCGHVFKQPDRFNGQAYDIYGRVFREPSGSYYTSGDSHVPITFPYTPKSEYVDVSA